MAVTNFICRAYVSVKRSFTATVGGTAVAVRPAVLSDQCRLSAAGSLSDLEYYTTGTLAAGATVDIDLDAAGFSSLQLVYVELTSATGTLKVGGTGGSNINQLWFNADADAQFVEQGGLPFSQGSTAGKTVNGTNKTFRITNTHGSQSADYLVYCAGVD